MLGGDGYLVMAKIETLRSKDLRRYSIMPVTAVQDPAINRTAALAVLAVICSYTDDLGRTFVSQARIAKDLGISRQAVNRQVKRLLDLGYLVYAKKQYKGQTTNTVKVVYDKGVKTEAAARSNLTSKQQIELAEREAELAAQPVDNSTRVQHQKLQGGATSSVAGGATSEVAYNETLTSKNNEYKEMARKFCVMFLRAADAYGTPRQYQEKDELMVLAWIKDGLTLQAWSRILQDHFKYCREQSRDAARALGYFQRPVQRAIERKGRRW